MVVANTATMNSLGEQWYRNMNWFCCKNNNSEVIKEKHLLQMKNERCRVAEYKNKGWLQLLLPDYVTGR